MRTGTRFSVKRRNNRKRSDTLLADGLDIGRSRSRYV
jgi:hypothetical protein